MKHTTVLIAIFVLINFSTACKQTGDKALDQSNNNASNILWKDQLIKALPGLGHRNWIVVADKAFPQQNTPGITYIEADEKLLPVLQNVLAAVNATTHVKPIVYRDAELKYINDSLAKGIETFVQQEDSLLAKYNIQTILHDSVFTKLDQASKLFKVLVIKTNEVLPYSSVFIQLDCAYWNKEKEELLRKRMLGRK